MEIKVNTETLQGMILKIMPFEEILISLLQTRRNYSDFDMNVITNASLHIIDFASRCRKTHTVERLLKIVSLLNKTQKEKFVALHYASQLGSKFIVETIIRSGADLNTQSLKKDTALHFATIQGHNEIVDILLKNGAECNIQNEKGWSALILAIGLKASDCMNSLLKAGTDVNLQDFEGKTALHFACFFNDAEKVKALINAGTDVNVVNVISPLHVLLNFKPLKISLRCVNHISVEDYQELNEIAELLIDANINVHQKDQYGNNALHKAVLLPGNMKLIKRLITAGVCVNEQNDTGETPLHNACKYDDNRPIRVLIDAGADIKIQSKSGDSVLHYAARFGSNESVKELILRGIGINRQNQSGSTALHISLRNRHFEIFETLLINRALICKKDNEGHDALWHMDNNDAILQVFKLQHFFSSYRDVYDNTILHIFLQKEPLYIKDKTIWSFIRTGQREFFNFLPVQNIFGQTILHIAAASDYQEAVSLIVSIFTSNLYGVLFLCDENGNTFLHTFLHKFFSSERQKGKYLRNFFKNEYQWFPAEIRKKLMESRNTVGNTPLHLIFQHELTFHKPIYAKLVFKMFIDAKANINLKNCLRETVLHRLMFSYESLPELARMAKENGSEVNVPNIFGETEIFIVPFSADPENKSKFKPDIIKLYPHGPLMDLKYEPEHFEFLHKSGCDISECNRIGQTAVMLHLKDKLLLTKVVFSKALCENQDKFGSYLMHYIAWDEGIEIKSYKYESFLMNMWCNTAHSVVQDNIRQLPCDVAFSRGHVSLLHQICVCKNGVHKQEPVFYQRQLNIKSLKEKDTMYRNCLQTLSGYCSESNIEDIMNVPLLGLTKFKKENNNVKTNIEIFDQEATNVEEAIVQFVKVICTRLGEKDKLLKNSITLSGSVGEKTKVGLPDEFDFICVLEKMSNMIDFEKCEQNEIRLKLKGMYKGNICSRFFDSTDDCLTTLMNRFYDLIIEILQEADMYSHPNLFRLTNGFRKPRQNSPNFKLKLRWCCCKFKNMTVKIDIVPAFKILCPSDSKVYTYNFNPSNNRSEVVMIMTQYNFSKSTLLVSASREEKQLLDALPLEAKEAYVISKILCGKRVCPIVFSTSFCSEIISSYMLKNCLFYVTEELQRNTLSHLSVHSYVCRIFQKLLQFAIQEVFPCYMFPKIDLFEYHDKKDYESNNESNKEVCIMRSVYAKLILNILGKAYDFDGIDVGDQFLSSIGGRNINIIQDNNVCANCFKSPESNGVDFITCSRCKLWTYCSDECQLSNLKRHKPACDYHCNNTPENTISLCGDLGIKLLYDKLFPINQ